MTNPKICLTIAGLDPSGGAGIIADIKTFTAFGCFATAAVTSLTFQNTTGVFGAVHQTAESVRGQVEPILNDFKIDALKTGMLPTREVIEEIARLVAENNLRNFVVDPVVRSTSGFDLIDDAALKSLIKKLFPLSDLITPNIPEAERIAQMKIENAEDIRKAAKIMQELGAKNVLIKGGHLSIWDVGLRIADLEEKFQVSSFKFQVSSSIESQVEHFKLQKESESEISDLKLRDENESQKNNEPETWNLKPETNQDQSLKTKDQKKAIDFLFIGEKLHIFEAEFIETNATHGTGCTLAAAVTANLANGKTLVEAVESAKKFVTEAIRTAPNIGKGHSPIGISLGKSGKV